MREKPPCKGCERRLAGCHVYCPEYTEWKKRDEANRKKASETPELCQRMKRYMWRRMLGR